MVGLEILSSMLGNIKGVDELTFSSLVVEPGEPGPEFEFRASCASEKTSSSASDASETTVSTCFAKGANTHLDHAPQDLQAQRSCGEGPKSGSWEDDRNLPLGE